MMGASEYDPFITGIDVGTDSCAPSANTMTGIFAQAKRVAENSLLRMEPVFPEPESSECAGWLIELRKEGRSHFESWEDYKQFFAREKLHHLLQYRFQRIEVHFYFSFQERFEAMNVCSFWKGLPGSGKKEMIGRYKLFNRLSRI